MSFAHAETSATDVILVQCSFSLDPKANKYMGSCQNYGPLFESPKYKVPYYTKDPKRDHNVDNHPYPLYP